MMIQMCDQVLQWPYNRSSEPLSRQSAFTLAIPRKMRSMKTFFTCYTSVSKSFRLCSHFRLISRSQKYRRNQSVTPIYLTFARTVTATTISPSLTLQRYPPSELLQCPRRLLRSCIHDLQHCPQYGAKSSEIGRAHV